MKKILLLAACISIITATQAQVHSVLEAKRIIIKDSVKLGLNWYKNFTIQDILNYGKVITKNDSIQLADKNLKIIQTTPNGFEIERQSPTQGSSRTALKLTSKQTAFPLYDGFGGLIDFYIKDSIDQSWPAAFIGTERKGNDSTSTFGIWSIKNNVFEKNITADENGIFQYTYNKAGLFSNLSIPHKGYVDSLNAANSSLYVPYTGAIQTIDLNNQNLIGVNELNVNGITQILPVFNSKVIFHGTTNNPEISFKDGANSDQWGHISAYGLYFKTNNTSRLFIDNAGNSYFSKKIILDAQGPENLIKLQYGSLSETVGSASTILGNNISAGSTSATVRRNVNSGDNGNFINIRYDNGISFHTGIQSTLEQDVPMNINERMTIKPDGEIAIQNGNWKYGSNGIFYWGYDRGYLTYDVDYVAMRTSSSSIDLKLGAGSYTPLVIKGDGNKVIVGSGADDGNTLQVNGTGRFSGALTGTTATFSAASSYLSQKSTSNTRYGGWIAQAGELYSLRSASSADLLSGAEDAIVIETANGGDMFFYKNVTANNSFTASTGISTGDPGQGSGIWKLGKYVSEANMSLVDSGYIEIDVDGVTYKLALAAPPIPSPKPQN